MSNETIYTTDKPYCVYLTIYRGNKLPPFYIGSSSVEKVNNGYHGSVMSMRYVDTWKSELKNNIHLFETKIISIHTTRELATENECKFQKQLNVVYSPLYINMAYASPTGYFGISLKGKDSPAYGREWSDESRKIASDVKKEEWKNPNSKFYTEEHKIKKSLAQSNAFKKPNTKFKTKEYSEKRSKQLKANYNDPNSKINSLECRERGGMSKSANWEITDPNGNTFNIRNMRKFCRENFLYQSNMGKVASGGAKQHKGYTCKKLS